MTDYSDLYQSAGQQYGVDPQLLQAMGSAESSQNPSAENDDTATGQPSVGLMQLQPGTAKEMGVDDATNPKQNINGGAKYYAQQLAKYKDQNLALAAYNWGPKNVDDWLASGADINKLPEETRNHLVRVAGNYQKLKGSSQTTEPVAMTSTQAMDPIEAALSDQGSATPMDPIEAALSEQPTSTQSAKPVDSHGASGDWTKQHGSSGDWDTSEDVARSIPSAIIRGANALPQIFSYGGNLATQVAGQGVGELHDIFSRTPLSPEIQNKLRTAQPFYTGDTLADAFAKSGSAVVHDLAPNLSEQQKANLQNVEDNGIQLPGQADKNSLAGIMRYQPQTTQGRLTSGAIQGAIAGPALGAGPVISSLGGLTGQAAQEAYPNNPTATLLGGMLPGGIKGAVNKLSGTPINPNVAQLAKDAADQGIKIPGGLLTNNPLINRTYSILERYGLTPKDNNIDNITRAVSKTMGANTNSLTRDELSNAKSNIGQMYEDVANATPKIDIQNNASNTLTKLANIDDTAQQTLGPDTAEYRKINTQINRILDIASQNNGTLPTKSWKDLTGSGSPLSLIAKAGGTVGQHAGDIKSALYEALRDNAPPDQVDKLNLADKYYKNYQTAKGVTDPVTGDVNPILIQNKVNQTARRFGSKGLEDLQNLGDIGKQFRLTPSSGTAENNPLVRLLTAIPETVMTGGAYLSGASIPASLGMGLGTYAIGKGTGSALASNTYRNYLINRSLKSANSPSTVPNALMRYGAPAAISSVINGAQQ